MYVELQNIESWKITDLCLSPNSDNNNNLLIIYPSPGTLDINFISLKSLILQIKQKSDVETQVHCVIIVWLRKKFGIVYCEVDDGMMLSKCVHFLGLTRALKGHNLDTGAWKGPYSTFF